MNHGGILESIPEISLEESREEIRNKPLKKILGEIVDGIPGGFLARVHEKNLPGVVEGISIEIPA